MDKKTVVETELLEFFILGFILFVVLFSIFALKLIVFQTSFNFLYKDISLPNIALEKIKSSKIVKSRPSITTVDDSKTPYNYNDDVVNYNTSFYSIILPYNLSFYARKKSTNKALKKLIEAHEQLHRQLLKNKRIKNDYQNNTYNDMLVLLNKIQRDQDEIYLLISTKKSGNFKKNIDKLSFNINDLKDINVKLLTYTERIYKVVFLNTDNETVLPYKEALIIIDQINNHIVMLNNKAIADYNTTIFRKGYDIKTFKKPEVTNIIERLEYNLNDFNLK